MRLTYPLPKQKDTGRKSLFNLVEMVWHTLLPLLFLFVGLKFNYLMCFFIMFSFFRIRPDKEDL